ncbi:hypothetical protein R1sor_024343 [Riccia sorocarpa]|uniref:DNA repair and recombination protein RAD54 n=1 Tax=Riccia sorocarpa TaxID=122646 RepID=A0ABD3GSH0_9MARC
MSLRATRVSRISRETTSGDEKDEEGQDEQVDWDCTPPGTPVEDSEDDDDEEFQEDEEDDEDSENVSSTEDTKSANIAALLSGGLVVRRQALLPKVLCVSDGAAVARLPFKSPCPGATSTTPELTRRLSARKRFIPWKSREAFVPLGNLANLPPRVPSPVPEVKEEKQEELPPDVEPLVLWQPDENCEPGAKPIVVDPVLVKFLRPHQREGVQFMFECVAGLREFSKTEDGTTGCSGCILADDMGLGKTLQSITLLWTLLRQGFGESPLAKRVLIVTPTSLVSNWESELVKWLDGRVNVMAVGESTRSEVVQGIANYLSPRNPYQVLIISYETFRLHADKFRNEGSCDLLICDEAHRLKNDKTLTNQALASLHCRRRVLLSGTPMQNDLEEFFAMVNFTNPGILGSQATFRKHYEIPVLNGREPDASEEARALSAERSSELSETVNQFILRRTNALLSNHLPPKIVQVVCCRLTDLQLKIYGHFVRSKNVRQVLEDKTKRSKVLASITALKKLCNHPKLIYDTLKSGGSQAAGFEDCMKYFSPGMFCASSRHGLSAIDGSWIELSGKMAVLARLLANIRQTTDDRIVLVSNYTQTLDLFAQICRERLYPYVRLDGTTSISKRQKLVKKFNDPSQNEFAFLLSSKAGGCGLNLIGGNRLVLFDPDWNPATDKQAAARVWRDGQKKRVYVYRFLAAGTIEEKVYQRQLSKEGLQKVVDKEQNNDGKAQVNDISAEELRDLFTLREDVGSDTHETLACKRCNMEAGMYITNENETSRLGETPPPAHSGGSELSSSRFDDIGKFAEVAGCLNKLRPWERQIGTPLEEDLKNWAHHSSPSTIPDALLQIAAGDDVTFAFTCQIDGKLAPVDSTATIGRELNSRVDIKGGKKFPLRSAQSGPGKSSTLCQSVADVGKNSLSKVPVKSGLCRPSVAVNNNSLAFTPPVSTTPSKRTGNKPDLQYSRKKKSVTVFEVSTDDVKDDDFE